MAKKKRVKKVKALTVAEFKMILTLVGLVLPRLRPKLLRYIIALKKAAK